MRKQKHISAILELGICLSLVLDFARARLIQLSWEKQKPLSEKKNEGEKLHWGTTNNKGLNN